MKMFALEKHRNMVFAFLGIIFLVSTTACAEGKSSISIGKSQTVSNEEIEVFLCDSYFLMRSIELLEIKDVVEYPGETQNEIMLTCTSVASNYYAKQTANWKLTFELFEDSWIGRTCEMGMHDCEVRELTVEELGWIICPEYSDNTYFEILDFETDLSNKIATAETIYYITYPAYYLSSPWTMNLYWDDEDMRWTYYHVSTYDANEEAHGMDWQIHLPSDFLGHYDIEYVMDRRSSFDIEADPENSNIFWVKNYSEYSSQSQYDNHNYVYNEVPFSFEFWRQYAEGLSTRFEIVRTSSEYGNTLYSKFYLDIKGNTLNINHNTAATLISEFVPQESYLRGTY